MIDRDYTAGVCKKNKQNTGTTQKGHHKKHPVESSAPLEGIVLLTFNKTDYQQNTWEKCLQRHSSDGTPFKFFSVSNSETCYRGFISGIGDM